MRRLASKTLGNGSACRSEYDDTNGNLRVVRVHGDLVLRGIADETFGVGEGDIRGGRSITLVVGDDLNTIILPDTDTTVLVMST